MNVFVFGGSFNPPHMSHVLAVTYLLAAAEPDQVLVVPCFLHPLAKGLAPFEDRVAMCERAMGWLPRTVVSRVEGELGGESRSLRTVAHLRATHPDWNLRLVVGADILLESERWHAFDQVKALAPLFVLGRAGFQAEGAPSRCSPSSRAAPCVLLLREGAMGSGRRSRSAACPLVHPRAWALPRWLSSILPLSARGRWGGRSPKRCANVARRFTFARLAKGCRAPLSTPIS